MNQGTYLPVVLLIIIVGWFSCTDSTSTSDSGIEATLTHEGFDFSTGQADTANYQNNDGETIVWAPDGQEHPDYPSGVWWRTYQSDENEGRNQTKDYGTVSFDEVTEAPDAWDDPPHAPLRTDHVIVAKCRDGYVKFKIIATDTSSAMWPAQVEYVYSESGTFSN